MSTAESAAATEAPAAVPATLDDMMLAMDVVDTLSNETETVSRFAVRVPVQTFDAVRSDKSRNGIVQNSRLGQKRRGLLEPEFLMPVLEGRLTHW
jgi:hypothetical protein